MKSFLTSLLLMFGLLFVTSVQALITTPYSNSFDNTGTVKFRDRVVIKVRANGTTAITKGQCVYYNTTSDDGITVDAIPLILPTDGKTGTSLFPACMAMEAIAVNKDGKCLVFGYTDALLFDGGTTAVAGEPIFCGSPNSAGRFMAIAHGSVNAYNRPVGQFLDASAASASVEAFVNFL